MVVIVSRFGLSGKAFTLTGNGVLHLVNKLGAVNKLKTLQLWWGWSTKFIIQKHCPFYYTASHLGVQLFTYFLTD